MFDSEILWILKSHHIGGNRYGNELDVTKRVVYMFTMLTLITSWHETIKIARVDNNKIWLCYYERRPKSTIKMKHLFHGFPYPTNLISLRSLTLVCSTCIYIKLGLLKVFCKQEIGSTKVVRLYIDEFKRGKNLRMNDTQKC